MNEKGILLELEEPLGRISSGISALELMVYGLGRVKDPYEEGLNAIWNYLREAELSVQEIMRTLKEKDS